MPTPKSPVSEPAKTSARDRLLALPRLGARAVRLVWETDRRLAFGLASLSVATGALPAAIAYLAKLLVDAVSLAAASRAPGDAQAALVLLAIELFLLVLLVALQRLLGLCDALLRVRLSQRVIEQVLHKALALELADFERPDLHDQLRLVRDQATERPLNLVRRSLIALQQTIALTSLSLLLVSFSPWLVVLMLAATIPALWVELRFNADAFRLFRQHSPEARRQSYLETLLTREDYAKEVKASGIGGVLLARHTGIFERFYAQDQALSVRRAIWAFALGLVSIAALGAAFFWVTSSALRGATTVGSLAMLFVVLRQAQGSSSDLLAVLAGLHEDNLYLSTLHAFLARPTPRVGSAVAGPSPGAGLRFEQVSFTYPDSTAPALSDVSLHLPPGTRVSVIGNNGAGKTTLLKLLTGLYRPSSGQVTLDGLSLADWDPHHLTERMTVMFQDFARYQLLAGENIGAGHPGALGSPERWREAARAAMVDDLIQSLPAGYETPLGQWFEGGRELSLGEWQRVAFARLFTKPHADIVVLDEPTASLDARAEAQLLEQLVQATEGRTAVLISHRSTWPDPSALVIELDHGRAVKRTGGPDRSGLA
jgi:ATP-binding cassette, subfamily B, bacterial